MAASTSSDEGEAATSASPGPASRPGAAASAAAAAAASQRDQTWLPSTTSPLTSLETLRPRPRRPRADNAYSLAESPTADDPLPAPTSTPPADALFHLSLTGTTTTTTTTATPTGATSPRYTLAPASSAPAMTLVPSAAASSTPPGLLDSSSPASPASASRHAAIVGGTVGAVVALLLLLLLLGFCCVRRRRRSCASSEPGTVIPPASNDPDGAIAVDPIFARRRNASSWPSRLSSAVVSLRPPSGSNHSQQGYLTLPEKTGRERERSRTFSSLFAPAPTSASTSTSASRPPFARFFAPPSWMPPQLSPAKRSSTALPTIEVQSPTEAPEMRQTEAGPEYQHSPLMAQHTPASPAPNWPLRTSTRLSRTFVGKWKETAPRTPVLQFPPPVLRPAHD